MIITGVITKIELFMQESSNTLDKTVILYLIYRIWKNIHTAMKGHSAQTMPGSLSSTDWIVEGISIMIIFSQMPVKIGKFYGDWNSLILLKLCKL